MFFQWLLAQCERRDSVGHLAALASIDKNFPRQSHRLYMLLKWCAGNGALRTAVKKAHAEWRVVRNGGLKSHVSGGAK